MLKVKAAMLLIAGIMFLVTLLIKRTKNGSEVDLNRTLIKLVVSCLNIVLLIIVHIINVFAEAFAVFKVGDLEKGVIIALIIFSILFVFSSCKLITKYMNNLEKKLNI
ncbi:MAG: hypothetical protein PHR25_01550 [Clostridia bacterium]|nr:hypothetical protein [Clostridia bacterium]MDD4375449.1 hypothetical protein [Clostridia bacterium]